ncbi:MAG: DUF2505 domain-containing protein [Minicystis sp.]
MTKFTLTHEINCDVDTFWKTFLDKSFNEALYRQELGFPEFNVIEQVETDTLIRRKVAGTPKMDVPGPVAKVLGPNFKYTEEGSMSPAAKLWTWKMTPSVMAEKMHMGGTVRCEPISATKCRRVAELTIEAKIFGIGGLMESSAEKQMRDGWDRSAVFMNKWFARQAK